MIDLEPEQRARHEKALNLRSAVVKDAGAPLLVLSLVGVGVFVAGLSVKFIETERVLREMRRNPVQYNSYAVFVAFINEIHEVVRSAVARGRRKVSGDLIAPGAVKRVLHYRQQLDVRIAHVENIGHEPVRELAVGERVPVGIALP